MKLDFKIASKITKENYPMLEHLPFNDDIEYNPQKTALALAKNYQYLTVKLFSGTVAELKEVLHNNILFIIKDKKNNIIDWHYKYSSKMDTTLPLAIAFMGNTIKAGHKIHNASKDFKMRQATGRDRVLRFRLQSMGIKQTSWTNESKKYNKHL